MFESKEEKKRKATRERVKRYREKQKQPVTPCNNDVTRSESVTDTPETKMICKCRYYTVVDGKRVCIQCGRPAPTRQIEDKIRRGIAVK
jgi:hypothetical protein